MTAHLRKISNERRNRFFNPINWKRPSNNSGRGQKNLISRHLQLLRKQLKRNSNGMFSCFPVKAICVSTVCKNSSVMSISNHLQIMQKRPRLHPIRCKRPCANSRRIRINQGNIKLPKTFLDPRIHSGSAKTFRRGYASIRDNLESHPIT